MTKNLLVTIALSASYAPFLFAAECRPTPSQTIGTHYEPEKAVRQDGDLGEGFVMSGRVLSARDCKPLANVKITHWQVGEAGRYLERFYAWRMSDENGAYRFETEWPNIRPPHVHFIVDAPGYKRLVTQWIGRAPVFEASFDLVLTPKD